MGMTLGEKILCRASNNQKVTAGQIVTANVDLCMSNDGTSHITINMFENQIKHKVIHNPDNTIFIADHFMPSDSVETANIHKIMRDFTNKYQIKFHEGDGVCHQIMIESYVQPGTLVAGADSHTCSYGALGAFGIGVGSTDFLYAMVTGTTWLMVPESIKIKLKGNLKKGVFARDLMLSIIGEIGANGANYKIMEFSGEAVDNFSMNDRIVLCNLAIEAGAKTGLMEPNQVVEDYLKNNRTDYREGVYLKADEDGVYCKELSYNLDEIVPVIARPHCIDDVVPVSECEGIKFHQGFIGSCSNGRIEELRVAASILKGKKVAKDVRLIITPASNKVYLQALKEGLINILSEAGAMIMNPNCSVCWGSCQGVIGENEVLLSTGTRNFKGRCGPASSKVYLSSAATVAASAIRGEICDPREVL
ncbi:3-isopropylmalate dehydratase large subunit [Anaeromicropila populeti]|uniref:3-isopropylmalate dehydratase large subunit n=1 Tax=Anaeromicropila populeti TaxID=37658 RepID=A0A1I6HSE3_9FIRM|nr:3-isopropylmalate dehydratase large subunit [Anaeromicropila populeti]SFR57344.1 3-isopropylmalate/(R)-2-methylmalate dehydratase large subunit [Anaeromicropila populeti]